ncbi:MAG: helix-turn-helix transcriptional regulator [Pseudomonadota bacterium]
MSTARIARLPLHDQSAKAHQDVNRFGGLLIGHLRRASQLNPDDVARALGVAVDDILTIEKGERELTVSEIISLADVIKFSAADFIEAVAQYEDTGKASA